MLPQTWFPVLGNPQIWVVSLVEGNYGTPKKFFKEMVVKVTFYSIWPERWDERCGVGLLT